MATTLLLLVFFLIQVVLGSQAATGGSLKYRGADISSLALVESQGTTFTDHQPSAGYVPESFEHILAAHGGNTARIRVWATGQYDLKYGLNMAQRVKAAGMTLVVDLHYSDTCEW
jgi:arabinogalactan endo-1,4-beta-galactosidase